MKITFITIGAPKSGCFKEAAADYFQRIKRYVPAESVIVKEGGKGGKTAPSDTIKKEGLGIRAKLRPGDFVVALADSGSVLDTKGFSKFVEDFLLGRRAGKERLCFVVGGAWGLDKDVVAGADTTLSLSRMTLPHELCLVVLLEQVYRALTIIKGEKYSH